MVVCRWSIPWVRPAATRASVWPLPGRWAWPGPPLTPRPPWGEWLWFMVRRPLFEPGWPEDDRPPLSVGEPSGLWLAPCWGETLVPGLGTATCGCRPNPLPLRAGLVVALGDVEVWGDPPLLPLPRLWGWLWAPRGLGPRPIPLPLPLGEGVAWGLSCWGAVVVALRPLFLRGSSLGLEGSSGCRGAALYCESMWHGLWTSMPSWGGVRMSQILHWPSTY